MKSVLLILITLFTFGTIKAQIAETPNEISPLLIGEKVPNITVYTPDNKGVQLVDIINKPTIMLFYRGSWCPYCNVHLSEIAKIESKIIKLGYQIIAISPDDALNLSGTIEKNKTKYKIFADKNSELLAAMGIAFKANQRTKDYISKNTQGITTEVLPVPSVFIVNEKSEILMEYINPDITKRITSKLLLSILKGLK
jgi:peroxiredoxin